MKHGRDWAALLDDLERAGLCNADVAVILETDRSTVARWKKGSEPLYYYGDKLVILHANKCSFVASCVPREEPIGL